LPFSSASQALRPGLNNFAPAALGNAKPLGNEKALDDANALDNGKLTVWFPADFFRNASTFVNPAIVI
jgi:hypothetical protein